MFNSFPQPKPDSNGGAWVHDWSAYQPVYELTPALISVPASSWQPFVDVTGKGFLKWCRAGAQSTVNSGNPSIRITVDGYSYLFETSNTNAREQFNEVNLEIPFKTSLKIELENRHTAAVSLLCDYLYFLQQSTPNPSKVTLLQQSQRKMGYLATVATILTDVVNVTGSGYLLGVKFLGRYVTATGRIGGSLIVDGVTKMSNRQLFDVGTADWKAPEVVGPIRFNTSLRVQTITTNAGSEALCFVWYSLD